jgi:hypothetical protein
MTLVHQGMGPRQYSCVDSVTNSTAFSPTDTMPLSTRAKSLMAVQSLAALLTSLLVIARAVSVLR